MGPERPVHQSYVAIDGCSAVGDDTYMGIGLGSDIDTGVGASHTPKDIGVTFLS